MIRLASLRERERCWLVLVALSRTTIAAGSSRNGYRYTEPRQGVMVASTVIHLSSSSRLRTFTHLSQSQLLSLSVIRDA
jgi:hypothetical protein